MIVLYWMTQDPVVATESMSLLEVRDLMVQHQIRRLPVVRNQDELCGMIGRSDLYRWVRPERIFGEISDPERQQLGQQSVAEQMTSEPRTCSAYEHVEDVCYRMSQEKIGAYPVLNRGHLVGILSESDLMRAISELTHQHAGGSRITLRIDQGDDELLYKIVDLSRRSQLRLLAVLTHPILDDSSTMATLRVDGSDVEKFVRALWDANYTVVDVS